MVTVRHSQPSLHPFARALFSVNKLLCCIHSYRTSIRTNTALSLVRIPVDFFFLRVIRRQLPALQLDCIWPVYQSVESGVYSCFPFQHHLYLRVARSQWTEVKRRREGGIANTNTRTSSPMILERKLTHVHQWKEITTWNLDV